MVVSVMQGQNLTVTGVAVVTGPGPRGAHSRPKKGPQGAPKSPKKSPGKEAAQKRAVKAKEGVVCFLEKGRKEELDAKALMVIGSLCPISVEGVIRELRQGIIPKGAEALSSHHIWMCTLPVGQHQEGGVQTDGRTSGRMYIRMDVHTDGRTYGQTDIYM
jgi:hypothetical protein